MKRVAILHYAAPPVVGGVESTIDYHASSLARAGYFVGILAGRGEPFHPDVTLTVLPEIDSRHPEVLAAGQALAKGEVPPAFFALRDRLVDRLRSLLAGFDVCIVHNVITLHKNLALTAALDVLAKERKLPLIAWSHDFAWEDSQYAPDLHEGYPWDLLRNAWQGVCYVVVSSHRREKLAELFGIPESSVRLITPGTDLARFLKLEPLTQQLVRELHLLEFDPLLLLPARITRRKNIQLAIRVVAVLKQVRPKTGLVITGPPGPHNPANARYLDSLKALCEEAGVKSNVIFLYEHGVYDRSLHVPDSVVADFFQIADALLFPSLKEGFGIPVLEAGLARLPVFATDIPPVRESSAGLAHLFDQESSPGSIALAIDRFLSADRSFQLKRRVIDLYTWEAIVQKDLIPLIEEVLK